MYLEIVLCQTLFYWFYKFTAAELLKAYIFKMIIQSIYNCIVIIGS